MALEQQAANVFHIARHVARITRQQIHDPRYRIVLFGSWVRGRSRERSDIDIGIIGPAPVDSCIMDSIRTECDALDTLYTIEIIDLSRVGVEARRTMVQDSVDLEAA